MATSFLPARHLQGLSMSALTTEEVIMFFCYLTSFDADEVIHLVPTDEEGGLCGASGSLYVIHDPANGLLEYDLFAIGMSVLNGSLDGSTVCPRCASIADEIDDLEDDLIGL